MQHFFHKFLRRRHCYRARSKSILLVQLYPFKTSYKLVMDEKLTYHNDERLSCCMIWYVFHKLTWVAQRSKLSIKLTRKYLQGLILVTDATEGGFVGLLVCLSHGILFIASRFLSLTAISLPVRCLGRSSDSEWSMHTKRIQQK